MVLATPPFNLYFLGWIGLVPLFFALRTPARQGFGEGFTAGFVYNAGLLYWLALNNGTDWYAALATMLATTCILAFGWGLGAWLWRRLFERFGELAWWILPFSWTAWEGLLGYLGELAFPWPLLALTQARFDPLLQIMEFTGVWGVSFWVAAMNVAVYHTWKGPIPKARRYGFLCFVVLALIPPFAIWHATSHYHKDAPTARVMVVQGNIPPLEKWTMGPGYSFAVYDSLTRAGSARGIDLAVWPETAVPFNLLRQSFFREKLTVLASEANVSIITGASDHVRVAGEPKPLNAAFLIDPIKGPVERGAKRQLVPLGERVPFQWIFPSLGKLNLGQAEFIPGPRWTLFDVITSAQDTLRFPALICYESAFGFLTREYVSRGANFLVTVSNDAWYGWSSEAAQINALSRFRCIETRRAMARASNSGISLICDQLGREIAQTKLFKTEIAAGIIPICTEETFYVRHGDLFLVVVTIIYGAALLAAVRVRKGDAKSE